MWTFKHAQFKQKIVIIIIKQHNWGYIRQYKHLCWKQHNFLKNHWQYAEKNHPSKNINAHYKTNAMTKEMNHGRGINIKTGPKILKDFHRKMFWHQAVCISMCGRVKCLCILNAKQKIIFSLHIYNIKWSIQQETINNSQCILVFPTFLRRLFYIFVSRKRDGIIGTENLLPLI